MFENIMNFFKKLNKKEEKAQASSRDTAKERLHLVLMQDRANVSADFLELMKQEIIEVIKKYIDVDESAIDVRLTNKENEDGTNGAPALYANIPILNIKNENKKVEVEKQGETRNELVEEVATKQENIENKIHEYKQEENSKDNINSEEETLENIQVSIEESSKTVQVETPNFEDSKIIEEQKQEIQEDLQEKKEDLKSEN